MVVGKQCCLHLIELSFIMHLHIVQVSKKKTTGTTQCLILERIVISVDFTCENHQCKNI